MAQQCQGRCGEVQAIATAATGLACFIFRFLRRPLQERTDQDQSIRGALDHFLKKIVGRTGVQKLGHGFPFCVVLTGAGRRALRTWSRGVGQSLYTGQMAYPLANAKNVGKKLSISHCHCRHIQWHYPLCQPNPQA